MKNIWESPKKPILMLAPMAGATDTVFRQIIASIGKPDLMVTEFLCVDQLYSPASTVIAQLLEYSENERPLIAQIWGVTPELFYNAAQMIVALGFDGLDINMGCPEKSVIKRGACSALIQNPSLAAEIVQATKEGVAGKIPVSVKTRIGFDRIVTEEWITHLLSQDIAALTVHGRTAKEMSKVPCHWEEIAKVPSIAQKLGVSTKIIGNGDVLTHAEAHDKARQYNLDGIMIGRGVFHDPYVFNPEISIEDIPFGERLELMMRHIRLYEETWGEGKNYAELKRFYKIYVNGFPGAAEAREKLMKTNSYREAMGVAQEILRLVT